MKKSAIFILVIVLFGCIQKENEVIHYFDQYTQENNLYGRNRLLIRIVAYNKSENKIVLEGQPGKYWLYEDFYEKYIEDRGLYRKFEAEYGLWYRFDSLRTSLNIKYPKESMFLYNNIIFSDKKNYSIKGKNYKVYAYAENNGSNGVISYYLDKFGFFAYDLNDGYYLMCTRSSEYKQFNKEILEILRDSLVKDTRFFSMYRFNKDNPNLKEY